MAYLDIRAPVFRQGSKYQVPSFYRLPREDLGEGNSLASQVHFLRARMPLFAAICSNEPNRTKGIPLLRSLLWHEEL